MTFAAGQSTLNPQSPQAHDITTLWWGMLIVSTIVFLGAVALLVLSYVARDRDGVPIVGNREGLNLSMVLTFGIAIPLVVLVSLFVVANFVVLPQTDAPAASTTRLTVQVVGKQWFWEVRYPSNGAVTANEIHIPVRTRVNVVATTADVIHSFWVPELNRKIDMIPGRENRVLLYANRPGRFRGQCAEYCGTQHAHMSLYVFAQPPAQFQAWLAAQARPRRAPATGLQRQGERVFETSQCASCHTMRGTPARGNVGPDLTHVGGRTTLAALTIPNTPRELNAWLTNPQRVKPGNRMPTLPLTPADRRSLVAYLESLR
ncbi:MAG TPA: cytochrome c oxidase subunit II [Solirubrobacteraceae bacterium]